ncbi:ISAs1 family transposase [Alteromonadaceae bacterium M269]|nr:ISAs1 family transposase [Alteromonadaceae bacterium M269]
MQLDWLRQHRDFTCGIPRRHCIANIIKALDSEALLSALMAWINSRREAKGVAHIAIDGKVMRGSWKASVNNALNVVSAYDVDEGSALYQQTASSKGKEGELARHIIDMLTIKNSIVTLDALHCQRDTLKTIIDANGDFVVRSKPIRKRCIRQCKLISLHTTIACQVTKKTYNLQQDMDVAKHEMSCSFQLPYQMSCKRNWPDSSLSV